MMSRPSTSSTLVSRKLSALTESYDGDTESLTSPGTLMENNGIDFSCNESLASPTFLVKLERIRLGDTSSARELSPVSFGSDTETETSTSNTSVVNYTDSEFCRVKRSDEELDESTKICNINEGCLLSKSTVANNRNDTVDDLSTLLFQSKFISDETLNTSFYGHVHCEENSAKESISGRPMFSDRSVMIENGSENISFSERIDQERKTERDIKEKQRALRNNFREIVKEARKVLRQTRAKRYRNEIISGRGRFASKKQTLRDNMRNNAEQNEKQSDTFLKNSRKVKDFWIGKPAQGSPRANNVNLLRHRKKQECLDMEKIQVQHLIAELTYLNLHEQATNVKRALTFTEEKEKELDTQLEEERRNIKSLKNAEKLKQRQEEKRKRLEEIRKIEAERKEKEAIERQRRVEQAKKRRERNLMLWESYHSAVLANSISRAFTFSYFPKLRLQPIERKQTEPQKLTHSAKHREARREK